MSAWSAQRKVNIFLTVMVIVIGIISTIIFTIYYEPITCDDGIQNGLETGVDCGGVCPTICPKQPKKVLDLWTRFFPVVDGVYSVVSYIENQNKNLYIPSVQYEILLYDEEGSVISRASEKTTIMPNGITPIFVSAILTGESKVATASFRFTEEPRFVLQPNDSTFTVSDIQIETPKNDNPQVRATVKYTGQQVLPEVDFVAVVYDVKDVAIAAARTFEQYLAPDEQRALQFSWVRPFTLRKDTCAGGICVQPVQRVEIIPVIQRWEL